MPLPAPLNLFGFYLTGVLSVRDILFNNVAKSPIILPSPPALAPPFFNIKSHQIIAFPPVRAWFCPDLAPFFQDLDKPTKKPLRALRLSGS